MVSFSSNRATSTTPFPCPPIPPRYATYYPTLASLEWGTRAGEISSNPDYLLSPPRPLEAHGSPIVLEFKVGNSDEP